MAEQTSSNTIQFEQATSLVRTHGILAIVFGALGVFGSLILFSLLAIATTVPLSEVDASSPADLYVGSAFLAITTLIFFTLPHVFFIISGVKLVRNPSPSTAKVLIIINLVLSVFWNLIILIFAIINLTQLTDYKKGYIESSAK